jgi:hypothetical protein
MPPARYFAGMRSGDLTAEQVEKLHERLRPMFSYLVNLPTRTEQRQFSRADRLYQEVAAARYAMQLLVDDLHRIRCGPAYITRSG